MRHRPIFLGTAFVMAFLAMMQSVTWNVAFCADDSKMPGGNSLGIADPTAEWWTRENQFHTVEMTWHAVRNSVGSSDNYQVEFPHPVDRQSPALSESFRLSGHRICYEAARWYAELDGEFAGFDRSEERRVGKECRSRW